MRIFWLFLTTPEDWPAWLAFTAIVLMINVLVVLAFRAGDAI